LGCLLATSADKGDSMISSKTWLLISVGFIIIEILPPPTHFFFLCVALGAIGAAIAAYFTDIVWIPWVVFSVVTVALVPLLIPLARFLFTPKSHPSNADEVINEKAQVIEEIGPNKSGVVKVRGETWRAISEGESIAKDATVQILRIDGTHVVVRRIP
jgi:inner membrane protein